MSIRTRSNRQASGNPGATATTTSAKIRKPQETDDTAMDVDDDGKENVNTKVKVVNGRGASSKKSRGATRKLKGEQLESVDCTCSKGDDGSPMILCSMCKIWYHFTCVDMTEPQAEEVNVYICPSCTQMTGRRSAMHWEGEQAIEECTDEDDTTVMQRRKAVIKGRPAQQRNGHADGKRGLADPKLAEALKFEAEESDDMDDSEDDYVEEGRMKRQSRVRRMSTTTSTSDDDAGDKVGRHHRIKRLRSPSHSPSVHGGKRKAKSASVGQAVSPAPPSKRKRSATGAVDHTAQDDPVRKYCLSKLEDMFKEVYLRYPYVHLKEEDDGEGQFVVKIIKKNLADMNDEEKEALVEDSRRFARELESCVYEIYAEPDKNGNPHAAAKYKDRFRTLQFNLSKPDRVVIHQRILSGGLSAKEISVMSSTDLADEETKQSIILAEKEALEHSILQKQIAPRAKITHKGLQDIEDVSGEIASTQDFELEKERQEDEKRDRERLARLKTSTTQANRQRTASISVPPESPVVPPSATSLDAHQEQWGAPPPVPLRAMLDSPVDETTQEQRPSLYVQTSSDFMSAIPEPELNLDDIIHIDEDQDASHTKATAAEGSTLLVNTATTVASPTEMTPQTPLSVSTTGISPFAQRQDRPRAPSFDLNALWNEQHPDSVTKDDEPKAAPTEDKPPSGTGSVESRDDSDNMELESVEANDQDFDMFLADDAEAGPQPQAEPSPPPSVENLPQVWTGKITMPLDSSMPQETTLVAHQIGGKPLGADSSLWKTLFPSDILRIEGRVPVENSLKYLVQMRMNPSKELYAVALVPAGPQDENDFKAFNNFLISKSRHGLVFPWGNRPKDYHPGRELYMVPLLQTHTLPEFIELLDDLKLPIIRSRDYLIGVWILNKGKLTPLPGQSSHPPPVVQPSPPVLLNQQPGGVPTVSQLPNPALASEVASLTPDQIQNILRTLVSTTQVPLAPQHGQVPQPPFSLHGPPPPVPPQPWIPQGAQPPPPPFPFNFPPPNVPFQPPPLHNSPSSPPRYDHQGSDREYDRSGGYDRDYRSGPSHDHGDRRGGGERGWRGQSRSRGRGRGRGDGHQERDFRSQRDSGWPRRPKTDGQDGLPW